MVSNVIYRIKSSPYTERAWMLPNHAIAPIHNLNVTRTKNPIPHVYAGKLKKSCGSETHFQLLQKKRD